MDNLTVDSLILEILRLIALIILVDPNHLLIHNFSFDLDRRVVDLNWGGIDNIGYSVTLRREVVDLLRIGMHGLRVIELVLRTGASIF